VIVERQVDCGRLYGEKRLELMALVRSLTADERATMVPATPAWSVQDVVAHVVGIAADLNALRFGGDDDPDAWTAAQVSTRRGRSVAELDDEWEREAVRFEEGLRLLGYETGSHFVGDLLQHSQDVRAALGRDRLDDDEALAVGLDHYLDTFHTTLTTAAAGSVVVSVEGETWTLGAGPEVASLATSRFELFRTLGGRRSAAQVAALAWSGSPEAVLPFVSPYPLPISDLVDPTA
jgi:uncharacterized protein (TIGR03083 family)